LLSHDQLHKISLCYFLGPQIKQFLCLLSKKILGITSDMATPEARGHSPPRAWAEKFPERVSMKNQDREIHQ